MSLIIDDYVKYDLYNLFLLNKGNFTVSLLRKAYQRQILIYHPDKFEKDLTESIIKEKYELFNLINNAYSILTNTELKKQYDEKRDLKENEERNFIDLKSQYNMYNKKNILIPGDDTLNFQKKMEEMNEKIDEKIDENNKLTLEDKLAQLQLQRNSDVLCDNNELNENFLHVEKIKPESELNFNIELINMNENRTNENRILEINNTNQEYNGLYNTLLDNKFASFSDAFN